MIHHFWPWILVIEIGGKWLFTKEVSALAQLKESNVAAKPPVGCGIVIALFPGVIMYLSVEMGPRSKWGTGRGHYDYEYIRVFDVVVHRGLFIRLVEICPCDDIKVRACYKLSPNGDSAGSGLSTT